MIETRAKPQDSLQHAIQRGARKMLGSEQTVKISENLTVRAQGILVCLPKGRGAALVRVPEKGTLALEVAGRTIEVTVLRDWATELHVKDVTR